MLEIKGTVFIGKSEGRNLVLDDGIEALLGGDRLWDMVAECSVGRDGSDSKSFMKGVQDKIGAAVPTSREEYFDKELGCFIIKVEAEFAGPLQGVKEFSWGGQGKGWNRIALSKIEGHQGSVDIEEDETLGITLLMEVAQSKEEYPVKVMFDGSEIDAKIIPNCVEDSLVWSAQGVGANQGLGYWGTAVGLAGVGESAPKLAQCKGHLETYRKGEFKRSLRLKLGTDEGNLEGGIKSVYFGTSFEGLRNVGWLWKLEFEKPFYKTSDNKLWLELSWSILRS